MAINLKFTSEAVRGVSFEFRGPFERGEGKSRTDEAYYVLRGTLVENTTDEMKKTSSHCARGCAKKLPTGFDAATRGEEVDCGQSMVALSNCRTIELSNRSVGRSIESISLNPTLKGAFYEEQGFAGSPHVGLRFAACGRRQGRKGGCPHQAIRNRHEGDLSACPMEFQKICSTSRIAW